MQEFYGGQFSSKFSGSISVSQFIERSRALDIFNVLQIREVAKKTILISDHNPEINRDAVLQEGLFAENLGKKQFKKDEDANGNPHILANIFKQAVLLRVEKQKSKPSKDKISHQLREKRQFLERSKAKTMRMHYGDSQF